MTVLVAALVTLLMANPSPVAWQPWDGQVFTRAKAEHRLVLLDLGAAWCHWCHVMDAETYADPQVRTLLAAHYVAVRVDQDAAAALAARYGNWGWPATIVFDADGSELVKRRGYLPPRAMASLLQAIVDDPTPGPSVVATPMPTPGPGALGPAGRSALSARLDATYDAAHGGWGDGHRLVQPEAIEREVRRALQGDAAARGRVETTLAGLRRLIDPVWGGLYQYSASEDWSAPHYERLTTVQAQGLRTFALAYAAWRDPRELQAAQDIARFLATHLTREDGAVFTSMDADLSPSVDGHAYAALPDPTRRALGLPPIDRHAYPREAGLVGGALAELAMASDDPVALQRALRLVNAMDSLQRADGSYVHGRVPGLDDTVAMGSAFLTLYEATGDVALLARAEHIAEALDRFRDPGGVGYVAVAAGEGPALGALATPVRDPDGNVAAARFANALFGESERPADRARADVALRLLTSPEVLAQPGLPFGTLLTDEELARPALHIVIVGHARSARSAALLAVARAVPDHYKRVRLWDPSQQSAGTPPPVPPSPLDVAYACGPRFCSPPARSAAELTNTLAKQLGQ